MLTVKGLIMEQGHGWRSWQAKAPARHGKPAEGFVSAEGDEEKGKWQQ
jgi:hypothetical protein